MRAALVPFCLLVAGIVSSGFGNAAALAGSQYVIIAAEPAAAGLEPGKVLKLDDTLAVPDGVTVTLLGEDGSVSAIPGPASVTVTDDGVGAVSKEKRSALAKVAGLLAGENRSAQALGVARSVAGKAGEARTDPWAVPFDKDGNACARAGAVTLGREAAQLAVSIAVEAAGKPRAELNWAAGESRLALPEATVAAAEEIEVTASGRKSLLRLRRLPQTVDEADALALLGWLIDQGCDRQALALARKLALEAN